MNYIETADVEYYSEELIIRAQQNDKEALDILVSKNMPLVTSLIKKYYYAKESADDLFQIGVIGLIKAIKRFDFTYNTKFSTYAVYIINGELKRHFRDDGLIKVNRKLKSIYLKVKQEQSRLNNSDTDSPGLYVIAKNINEDYEDVCMAIQACSSPEYIYAKAFNDDNGSKTNEDFICDDKDETDKIIELIDLKNAILRLDKQKRQIIVLRFFKNMTQSEVAKIMGVSQVQISRTEKKILQEMRNEGY